MASRQNYRPWTSEEDAKLVATMVDLVNAGGGFKADNGFKAGYLKDVENALKQSLPDSGLLVALDTIVKNSETAEAAVWDAYIKVHKEASRWRNKSIPFFDDLCIIFCKDRVKGDRARDFAEMEEEANKKEEEDSRSEPMSTNLPGEECTMKSVPVHVQNVKGLEVEIVYLRVLLPLLTCLGRRLTKHPRN